jgi:hypothetical protein
MPHNDRDFIVGRRDRKPEITFDELYAGDGDAPVHPNVHGALFQAIQNKNFVTLSMHGHEVSGEPHVYGMRGGHPMVLIYNQETEPKWSLANVREVESVKIWLDERFTKREIPSEFDPDKGSHGC